MPDRTYTDEEVREILRRAMGPEAKAEGLGRRELIEAAAEVGIDAADVERAINEVELESEVDAELAQRKQHRKRDLASSATNWAIMSGMLAGIDLAAGGGLDWFFWPAGGWAIMLAFKLKASLFADPREERERARRSVDRRRRQREREQEREAAARARRELSNTAGEAVGAVERGVQELLGAARRAAAHRAATHDAPARARVEEEPSEAESPRAEPRRAESPATRGRHST